MSFNKVFSQVNIPAVCKKYGLSLWQCPQFLFLVMGVIIIGSSLATYTIGTKYIGDPFTVAFIVLLVTIVLFVIAFVITRSFEGLAETNRRKSEFVSIISHQLRAPLSNLKWAIEFLISGRADSIVAKQLEYFKIIRENSDRMEELVSDLLTISKLEMTNVPQRKQEVDLGELVRDLASKFKPFAESSNVEIKIETEPGLPKVFIDISQIHQVITNLLDNAIRYIKEKGEVDIRISKQKNCLYFEIKDNGVGIPEGDTKYIFQKFFRSENALRYQTQGSGLGLYIAKAVIEKMGGKIGFKSQEGKGSTFYFTLPIKNK